jgi:hypothetical protein
MLQRDYRKQLLANMRHRRALDYRIKLLAASPSAYADPTFRAARTEAMKRYYGVSDPITLSNYGPIFSRR